MVYYIIFDGYVLNKCIAINEKDKTLYLENFLEMGFNHRFICEIKDDSLNFLCQSKPLPMKIIHKSENIISMMKDDKYVGIGDNDNIIYTSIECDWYIYEYS